MSSFTNVNSLWTNSRTTVMLTLLHSHTAAWVSQNRWITGKSHFLLFYGDEKLQCAVFCCVTMSPCLPWQYRLVTPLNKMGDWTQQQPTGLFGFGGASTHPDWWSILYPSCQKPLAVTQVHRTHRWWHQLWKVGLYDNTILSVSLSFLPACLPARLSACLSVCTHIFLLVPTSSRLLV